MMEKTQNQVYLFKLVFTHNWEDPESDHSALKIKKNELVLAITSGGCNVLGFLMFDPEVIYSIDINPAQSYLLELKIAAIKSLNFEEFIMFSGLKECNYRQDLFQKFKPILNKDALVFWEENPKIISNGFIMNGKYERFIKLAGKFINLLQGKKRILGLLKDKTESEQKNYFDTIWNTKRFYYLFKILFNKRMIAKRGLVADYFHFDDGSKSFAESFYNRSKKAFRNIPVKGNYFLSLYLLGKYKNEFEVPAYLRRENFEVIKGRIDRIKIITEEAQKWIDSMPNDSIDCFALSNICELMSENETNRLFASVYRTSKNQARVSFRNLMIPRDVPDSLKLKIVKNESLSKFIYDNDRSFVYGKVAAYVINNKKMKDLYSIPVKKNIAIIVICSILYFVLLYIGSQTHLLIYKFILGFVFGFVMIPVYSLMHESAHNTLHPNPLWNRYLGHWLCNMFIISFSFFRHCHLKHHKKNRTDEEMWDLYYEHQKKWLRFGNLYLMMIGFGYLGIMLSVVLFAIAPQSLNSSLFKKHNEINGFLEGYEDTLKLRVTQIESICVIVFQVLCLWFIHWDFTTWIIFYLIHGFIWSSQNYVNHAFSPRDIINGAHNLVVPVWMNLIYLNFNLHLAHHQNPKIPWLHLPHYIKNSEDKTTFLRNYLRLWKGPRLTKEPSPKNHHY